MTVAGAGTAGALDVVPVEAIAVRVAAARARIAAAAERAGRDPADVALVAVTKNATPMQVVAALAAGVVEFAENRVADAEARIRAVAAALDAARFGGPPPHWRFIGHMQRNKARRAVDIFDAFDSVDSTAIAGRLNELGGAAGRILPILLEVNITVDPARSGFAPDALPEVVGDVLALPHLAVEGLMAIGPHTSDVGAQRAAFAALRTLRDGLAARYPNKPWSSLSMGMSDDFEQAIAEGSTAVRIGRALFDFDREG
ncbi:MAG: YggS family pyridoxal phosphate-dependent enzyme [Ardenticatenales bacterium]